MKKIIAMHLAMVMILSMVACGQKAPEAQTPTEATPAAPAVEATEAATEAATEEYQDFSEKALGDFLQL